MLRVAAALACLIAPVLAADLSFPEKGTAIEALECTIAVPEGWEVHRDRIRLVAIGGGTGFVVTREHMFHEERDLEDLWQRQLDAAGLDTRVKKTRVSRKTAFRAEWKKDGRKIEVYRVHLEDHGMLYNFAFSAPEGADLEPLVDGVLDSFECTAKEPELVFDVLVTDGRMTIRLPHGFVKHEGRIRGPEYVLEFEGYERPHRAGYISILSMNMRTRIQMADGAIVAATDTEGLLRSSWNELSREFAEVDRKPRVRSAYFGGEKGDTMYGTAVTQEGIPVSFFGFAVKADGYTYVIRILVDSRFERLHRNYFKELCDQISFRKD